MKRILFLLFLMALLSCNPNWGKYGGYRIEYLSGLNYYIALDKGEVITGADSEVDAAKKGIVLKYFRPSGKIDTMLVGKDGDVIRSFVDKNNISFDNKFILVDQKPFELICHTTDYDECKKALKESQIHQYWIIDKTKDYVYGPLTKDQFLNKKKDLQVPLTLKVKLLED